MAVVVVGDIETELAEEVIRAHFADMPAREKQPAPEMGTVADRELAFHHHYEEEAGETSLSIEALQPRVDPADTKARRQEDLERMLAARMVNRRLERIAKREESPVSSARMHAGDFFDLGFALYGSIEADCKPENWEDALALIDQELRRAIEHGFTESELEESKTVIRRLYEESADQMGTRKSRDLANQIARRIGQRRVFTSPAEDLERVSLALESIDADTCREALASLFENASETLVFVSGNADIDDNALATIEDVFRESREVAVSPPEETEVTEFAYADLPDAGAVAEKTYFEDLDVTQLRFENNIRANIKPTDYEDNVIDVKARVGAGLLTEPTPGLAFFLGSVFTKGGLEAHSEDDLESLFAGESVQVRFDVEDDAFIFTGSTTPEDLLSQLTLMRAYLTHPGFRPESAIEFRRALDYLYQQLGSTPGGIAQDEVSHFLHSGDSRFGYPPREEVEALTLDQARSWVVPALESAYLEISLVGDLEPDAVTEALAATFGSLPEREAEKPDYTGKRQVDFPGATAKVFEFESDIPKGMAIAHWPTTHIYEIHQSRRLGMLSAILDDRLRVKIREELGDAYSPFAHNLPSDTWIDYGYIFASVTVDPDQADSVLEAIGEISAELSTGEAITEDELERAKKPQVTQIEEMRRTNRYWMGSVLESSQEYPERLEWARTFVEDYQSITVEEVNDLAAEYLGDDTKVTVKILPVDGEEADADADAEE